MVRNLEVFLNGYDLWGGGKSNLSPIIQNLGISIDSPMNFKEYSLTTGGSTIKWLPDKSKKISFTSIVAINGRNAWNPYNKVIKSSYDVKTDNITADSYNTSDEELGIKIIDKYKALATYASQHDVSIEVRQAELQKTKLTKLLWSGKNMRITKFDWDINLNGTIEFKWEFTENKAFTAATQKFNSFNYKGGSSSSSIKCGSRGWASKERYYIGTCLPTLWNKGKFYYGNKTKTNCDKCVAYWQYYILKKKYQGSRVSKKGTCKSLNVKGRKIDGWWDAYTQRGTNNYLTALYKKYKKAWKKSWSALIKKNKSSTTKEFLKFFGTTKAKTETQKYFKIFAYRYTLKYCKGCTAKNLGFKRLKCKTAAKPVGTQK